MMTSSPGLSNPSMVAAIASVQPLVTVIWVSGSTSILFMRDPHRAMASRSAGTPGMGAYWLWALLIAAMAASLPIVGPSKSGNPWERLTALWVFARAVISEKIVVPKGAKRLAMADGLVGIGSG